jgi:hypothetical protein
MVSPRSACYGDALGAEGMILTHPASPRTVGSLTRAPIWWRTTRRKFVRLRSGHDGRKNCPALWATSSYHRPMASSSAYHPTAQRAGVGAAVRDDETRRSIAVLAATQLNAKWRKLLRAGDCLRPAKSPPLLGAVRGNRPHHLALCFVPQNLLRPIGLQLAQAGPQLAREARAYQLEAHPSLSCTPRRSANACGR